jgi:cytochrome c peroxidase
MSASKTVDAHLCYLDNRTTSTWQSFGNDQTGMVNAFKDAMAKLAVVGQDTSKMIDCSAVIPKPQSS